MKKKLTRKRLTLIPVIKKKKHARKAETELRIQKIIKYICYNWDLDVLWERWDLKSAQQTDLTRRAKDRIAEIGKKDLIEQRENLLTRLRAAQKDAPAHALAALMRVESRVLGLDTQKIELSGDQTIEQGILKIKRDPELRDARLKADEKNLSDD